MRISGVSVTEFRNIVSDVSESLYHGNVTVRDITDHYGVRRPRISATLSVRDSHAYGARTSWSGRHMPAASWEAHRDVLTELFERHPDALVRTSMAVYRGKEGFNQGYPQTAYRNIGSMMNPVTMPELSIPEQGDTRSRAGTSSRNRDIISSINDVLEDWESSASRTPMFIP